MQNYTSHFDLDGSGYFTNVQAVFQKLRANYRETDLGNKDDPLDELVYIVLSTRTREEHYQAAFDRVRSLVDGWESLPAVALSDLEAAIGSAGLATKKSETLKGIADFLCEDRGEISLDHLQTMSTVDAERYLQRLPGVGIKTAKCVLMYALDRPSFPIDIHCLRVTTRIGWFEANSRQLPIGKHRAIENSIPEQLRKPLHILFVQHGRELCRPKSPECHVCPVQHYCEYGTQ